MYFADSVELQGHLNEDWSVFLINLKARGEHLHQLLQYNHQVVGRRLRGEELFTNDQILQHHSRIASTSQINAEINQQEIPILAKYESTVVGWEGVAKLMQRVAARVLEAFQQSLDKCKTLDEELVEKHARMRQSLVRLINQRDNIDLQAIGCIVVSFARENLSAQIQRLKQIVAALQSGEILYLQLVYDFKAKRTYQLQMEKQKAITQRERYSSVRQQHSLVRQEIRKQEGVIKQKQKVAIKLVQRLYSMLDLSRQPFIENICGCESQKQSRLYNQILSRNRLNHLQILSFQRKKYEFQEKVRLFKQMMRRQSAKTQLQLIHRLPKFKINDAASKESEVLQMDFPSDRLISQFAIQEPLIYKKPSTHRYRMQSPIQKQKVKEFLSRIESVGQVPIANFNHLKFDLENQQIFLRTNRKRLPLPIINPNSQALSRASSIDQRLALNSSKVCPKKKDEEGLPIDPPIYQSEDHNSCKQFKSRLQHKNRQKIKEIDQQSNIQSEEKRKRKKINSFDPSPNLYRLFAKN